MKFKKKKKNRKKKEDEHDISWSFFISILSLLFSALLCLSYKEMKLYNYDRIIFSSNQFPFPQSVFSVKSHESIIHKFLWCVLIYE